MLAHASALGMQRQVDLGSLKSAWSAKRVQDIQGYTEKLCLGKNKVSQHCDSKMTEDPGTCWPSPLANQQASD